MPKPLKKPNRGADLQWLFWDDYYYLLYKLINEIQHDISVGIISIDKVVGIANGGLNISIPIAATLRVPHERVLISHSNNVMENIDFMDGPERILVVDDIVDSGATTTDFCKILAPHHTLSENMWVAALYKQEKFAGEFPHYYADTNSKWVVFPYELD